MGQAVQQAAGPEVAAATRTAGLRPEVQDPELPVGQGVRERLHLLGTGGGRGAGVGLRAAHQRGVAAVRVLLWEPPSSTTPPTCSTPASPSDMGAGV